MRDTPSTFICRWDIDIIGRNTRHCQMAIAKTVSGLSKTDINHFKKSML